MAERLKAHAWKACVLKGTVGSNPTLSATIPQIIESASNRRKRGLDSGAADLESKKIHAPVAQLDRASACGAEGRTFESCRARQ